MRFVVRAILVVNVLILFWVGIGGMTGPQFSGHLLALQAGTRLGQTEIRALNGGVLLAMGLALAWAPLSPGLVAGVGIAMATIGGTRTFVIATGGYDPTAAWFAATELLTAAACALHVRAELGSAR